MMSLLARPVVLHLQCHRRTYRLSEGRYRCGRCRHTFGLLTGAPLFNLPDGFTVNSPTSFIVHNQFTPTGVPEPAAGTLLLLGLVIAFLLHRHGRTGSIPCTVVSSPPTSRDVRIRLPSLKPRA